MKDIGVFSQILAIIHNISTSQKKKKFTSTYVVGKIPALP